MSIRGLSLAALTGGSMLVAGCAGTFHMIDKNNMQPTKGSYSQPQEPVVFDSLWESPADSFKPVAKVNTDSLKKAQSDSIIKDSINEYWHEQLRKQDIRLMAVNNFNKQEAIDSMVIEKNKAVQNTIDSMIIKKENAVEAQRFADSISTAEALKSQERADGKKLKKALNGAKKAFEKQLTAIKAADSTRCAAKLDSTSVLFSKEIKSLNGTIMKLVIPR